MTLVLSKLAELLIKNSYTIDLIWMIEKRVKMIEVRSPKMQKSFMIYIPQKYNMVNNTQSYKTKIISETDVQCLAKQIDHIADIKGTFLDCDLVSFSSDYISIHKNNGMIENYMIGISTKVELPKEEDHIEKLISESEDALKEIDPEITLSKTLPNDIILDNSTIVTTGDAPLIDLEFIANEPIEDGVDDFIASDSDSDADSGGAEMEISEDDDTEPLGILYYAIDISTFYKKMGGLEDEIVSTYNTLDNNESELRDDKLIEIQELSQELVSNIKEKLEKYKKEESNLKAQISKLTLVLDKTLGLKNKMKIDPEKYVDEKGDVDKIYNQTRNTIHDINIDLLKIKDEMDDELVVVHTTLEGLLDLKL